MSKKTGGSINCHTILHPQRNAYAYTKYGFKDLAELYAKNGDNSFTTTPLVHLEMHRMYGPGDKPNSFINHLIRNCLLATPSIALTSCEQRRDFLYIEDVVSAFACLVEQLRKGKPLYSSYDLGSGTSVLMREIATIVRELTGAGSQLNFGALPYNAQEEMTAQANPKQLHQLGWSPRYSLRNGLEKTIAFQKEELCARY